MLEEINEYELNAYDGSLQQQIKKKIPLTLNNFYSLLQQLTK